MGWKICTVATCMNTQKNSPHLSFHRFPRDENLRKIWVMKCCRGDEFNIENARICSAHFQPDDFEREIRAELIGSQPRKVLKLNVVPTLNLKERVVSQTALDRIKQQKIKEEQKEHHCLIEEDLLNVPSTSGTQQLELEVEVEEKKLSLDLVKEEPNYKELYLALLDEKNEIQKRLDNAEKKLLESEKSKYGGVVAAIRDEEMKALSILQKVFSPNEITLLSEKNTIVHWTLDEIRSALTLRYLSKKAYVYLRDRRGFPFPSVSSLKRWAARLKLKNRNLFDV